MQLEISRWVRDADSMNADLKEASIEIKSIIASIGLGIEFGKELYMLQLAHRKLEKINVGAHTWHRPLTEASKVEAVRKAIIQLQGRFFGPFPKCFGQPQVRLFGAFPKCFSQSDSDSFHGFWASFTVVQSRLAAVLDDLHISKVLANIFQLTHFHSTAPGLNNLDHVDEVGHAPTEQLVHHADEPVIRDEELVRLQAEHDWADGVVRVITDPASANIGGPATPDTEQVFLFRFSRTPPEFKIALQQGRQLAAVRDQMKAADCAYTLPAPNAGAKVFVWPQQYQTVMDAIGKLETPLFSSNVVILESLMPCLEDIIAEIPRKANVHEKERQAFTSVACIAEAAIQSKSSDNCWGNLECVLAERRTFLCIVRVLRDPDHVTQSTTEAYGGVNPRRFALESDSASSACRKLRRLDL